MKVYLIWYMIDLSTTDPSLWGIYSTEDRANQELKKILEKDYSKKAWINEEEVL